MPQFGNWEYKTLDLAAGTKVYFNRVTGEISEDPPDEVLEILEARNRQRRPQVYEPTPFRFAPLPLDGDAEPGSVCRCCGDFGFVEGLGTCPLCDGEGSKAWMDAELIGAGNGREAEPSACPEVQHLELLEGDGRAALLRNFLTPTECRDIILQAEGFGLRSCGYSKTIRITDRVSVMGEDLAAALFARARPFLHDIEVTRDRSCESGRQGIRTDVTPGIWSPVGLNPCFRVCRYDEGGFFLPHFDHGFDDHQGHVSLKTFMLYLNDGFDGAPTTFYSDRQAHYKVPDPVNKVYDLQPERGACVIFNHCITHDGGMLRSGQKYILRTEVMYRWRGRRTS